MACRITEFVLDCADPESLTGFWCAVLGYEVLDRDEDGSVELGPPAGAPRGVVLALLPSTEPKTSKLRLHLDVNATDRDQDSELTRLLDLGARPVDVGQSGEESWHVLADPEGHEFCLLHRTVDP